MKVLNLDEISPITRTVRLQGKEYAVEEMSVSGFIETMQKARTLEARIAAGEEISPEEQLQSMIDSVAAAVPTCPKDVIATLKFEQLSTFIRFINGDMDTELKAAAEAASPQPATEGEAGKKS